MVQSKRTILIVILLISTLTQIFTDMYTPSLVSIAHYFGSSMQAAQYTMVTFMLGVALSNFIYGPLSEGIGRRWALIIGILISLVGSVLCLVAASMMQLELGRLIQGCGLGAATALWRSIFRDSFDSQEISKIASYLTNVIFIWVIVAPILGGYFEHYLNWRATFLFLLIWSIFVLFIVMFFFRETGQHHGRHRLNFKFVFSAYKELLLSPRFLGFTLCSFATYGGMFAWVTTGPIILIHDVGIKPIVFGWLSIIFAVAMLLAGTLNGMYVKRLGSSFFLHLGWGLMILGGLAMLLGYYYDGIHLLPILIPAVLAVFGSMFIYPNVFSLAFTEVGHIAGYAGALYSGIQLIGGVVFGALISHLNTGNQISVAWLFILSASLALLLFYTLAKKN